MTAIKNQLEELNKMREVLLSSHGWGFQNVNQDTRWNESSIYSELFRPYMNNGTDVWAINIRRQQTRPSSSQESKWNYKPMANIGGTWGDYDAVETGYDWGRRITTSYAKGNLLGSEMSSQKTFSETWSSNESSLPKPIVSNSETFSRVDKLINSVEQLRGALETVHGSLQALKGNFGELQPVDHGIFGYRQRNVDYHEEVQEFVSGKPCMNPRINWPYESVKTSDSTFTDIVPVSLSSSIWSYNPCSTTGNIWK